MAKKTVKQILDILDERAPAGTAESWDNVGLLVGSPTWQTDGAIISIDLSLTAIEAARDRGFKLIIAHHPCIFPRSGGGLGRLVAPFGAGGEGAAGGCDMASLVAHALISEVAVAACHTNFDQCSMEVLRKVSEGLGLAAKGRLLENTSESLLKLVVFIPITHSEKVREAICLAGAGQIGNYDSCSFSSPGEGTFRGAANTNPFIGQAGKQTKAQELRLETVLPRGLRGPVLQAMRKAHPYEEVAFDLYALEQAPPPRGIIRGLGYGFWGEYLQAKSFSELAQDVKTLFKVDGFRITSLEPPKPIRRLAFAPGKGTSFIDAALEAKCELFVTGEIGYHASMDAARRGLAVIELGHSESERFFVSTVDGWLSERGFTAVGLDPSAQKLWRGEHKQ